MTNYFTNNEPIVMVICILKVLENFQPFEMYFIKYAFLKFNFLLDEDEKQNFINTKTIWDFVFILFFMFFTDGLRYRPIIILNWIIALSRYILFFFPPSIFLIQIEVILSSIQHTSAIASTVYLYSKIRDKSKYQRITAYVNAFFLFGICFSSAFGTLYADILNLNLSYLLWFNTAIIIIMLISTTFVLPSADPEGSLEEDLAYPNNQDIFPGKEKPYRTIVSKGITHFWFNFKTAYTNPYVLKWSIWWSLTSFLAIRVQRHYVTFLASIQNDETYFFLKNIHPVVFLIFQLTSAALMIICSLKPTKWETRGDPILSFVSFLLSVLAIVQYFDYISLSILTGIHALFGVIVEVFLTICLWEIVQIMPRNSYALVVGFNTLVFDGLHSVLPFSVRMTDFVAKQEFVLYGLCFAVMGVVFGLAEELHLCRKYYDMMLKRRVTLA